MTLTARIFLLVALAVVPTFALLVLDNYERLQQRQADAEQEALRTARLVSAELVQIFKGIESLLRAAAQTPMVEAFQSPECSDHLMRLEAINPNSGRLIAVDATGSARCGAAGKLASAAEREAFQAALESDELVVGGYTIGMESGAATLPLAIRFESSEGPAVLIAELRLDWLSEHFSRVFSALPPLSSLTIVDRAGIMLVRLPNKDRAGRPLQNYEHVVNAARPGVFRSTAEKNADGIARFLGFTPIGSPPQGVAIAVGFPQAAVLAEARASALRNAVLTALAIVFAFSAAALAGRAFIHRPASRLLATIDRWRTGDLSARAPHRSDGSEFEKLGVAFNSMAAELGSVLTHKDILLRELSHRVMNSLQTISALFRLQANAIRDPADAAHFRDAIRRIDALALAYKRIQSVQGVETMEFASFLVELCDDLRASVMQGSCEVRADPVMLTPEQAIPLSLIVNELLTNAIKHTSREDGVIVVELKTSPDRCRLSVRNAGSLPETPQDESKGGFGTKMISSMVAQLRGDLEVSSADGHTEFAVTFRPAAQDDRRSPPDRS